MEKITSFTIDHNKLVPGLYVSRKDHVEGAVITTFDIRMTNPNEEPVMNTAEMHTIEHLAATFLQYDPADVPILIAAFAFGPVAGILVTVLASFIQAFFLGGDGIYGFLMHVIATGILVTVASTLYRKFHTRTGAIIGLLLGTFAMGVGMMIANHFITPFYMGAPTEMVDAMLVTVILPFNLLKAGINSVVTFLVYKSVSKYIVHGEEFAKAPKKAAGEI